MYKANAKADAAFATSHGEQHIHKHKHVQKRDQIHHLHKVLGLSRSPRAAPTSSTSHEAGSEDERVEVAQSEVGENEKPLVCDTAGSTEADEAEAEANLERTGT